MQQSQARYLVIVALSCASFLLLACIINYVIDPYNFFQSTIIPGINSSKPATSDRTSFSKIYMIEKARANTVIVGSSRIDVGINPDSKYIPSEYKPAFNIGVPGVNTYDQLRYIQHATAIHKPKLIIVGLDFNTFLVKKNQPEKYPPKTKEYENRLMVTYAEKPNPKRRYQYLKDVVGSLLSNTALLDSIKTIFAKNVNWLTSNGLSSAEARFASEVRSKGSYSVFRDKIQDTAVTLSDKKLILNPQSFRAFDDIIKFCSKRNIRLIVIIPPSHVFRYEVFDKLGLWADFEKWKEMIVKHVDAMRISKASNVSVWDFALYSKITTEVVPKPHDTKNLMKWFWEPVHFKKTLGEQLLSQIFNDRKGEIGRKIDQNNIYRDIKEVRLQRKRYELNREQNELLLNMLSSISLDKSIKNIARK